MATNYTFAQACAIINKGTDAEAIADIGRRYPILLHKVSQVTAVAGDKFVDLMNFMPDYLTANKVNSAMKSATAAGDDSDNDDSAETDSTETTDSAESSGGMPNFESMSAKQLWDILGKAGKRKTAKSTKKSDLVAACKAMYEGPTETEDDSDDSDESADPYAGKSAMELFKECKKRGLTVAPKKPAKFYADQLKKADAEENSGESDDGWDEDSNTEEKTEKAKGTSAKSKSGGKNSAKSEASDDDDNWDI